MRKATSLCFLFVLALGISAGCSKKQVKGDEESGNGNGAEAKAEGCGETPAEGCAACGCAEPAEGCAGGCAAGCAGCGEGRDRDLCTR